MPGAEGAQGSGQAQGQDGGDILREELARLLDAGGGAPDAGDALDVLWIARLSGLEPVDPRQLGGNGTDPRPAPVPTDPEPPVPPADRPTPHPGNPSARLHLPDGGTNGGGTTPPRPGGAHTVRVAQPRALAQPLSVARALRPLRQTVPSPYARALDVDATAAASGDTGLFFPVLCPAPERRFSVDLLIDTGTTMTVWHRLADELRTLLARHGAFADVRAWALHTDGPEPTLAPFRRVARGTGGAGATRRWRQALTDPTGRRAVLVLTDGVGPSWYGDELPAALAGWSRRRPVAALQVLPSRLWHRTALRTAPVRARGTEATRATIEVRSSGPLPGIARGRAGAAGRTRIRWLPVLEVSGDWLAPWARLVSGATTDWTPLEAVPLTGADRPGRGTEADEPTHPATLIERFEEGYLPESFRLLRLLAAAPLSLPVMRLIQRTMLPASTPMHLAEIFLSGLLVRRTPAEPGEDPDSVLYDFRDGVREALLDRLTRTESRRVLRQVMDGVSDRVAATLGGVTDFPALVAGADGGPGGRELPAESRAFAEVAVAVISGAGGDYAEVAERLRRTVAPTEPVPEEGEGEKRRRGVWPFSRRRARDVEVAGAGREAEVVLGGARVPSQIPLRPWFYGLRLEAGADVMNVLTRGMPEEAKRYPILHTATCVIEGARGVGKTTVAAVCAEALAPQFTMVRWIRAHSREALMEDLVDLAHDLGISRPPGGVFPSSLLDGLHDYLRAHPGWLLIYDDVNPESFTLDIRRTGAPTTLWRPPERYGSLLVTLREGTEWLWPHETVTLSELRREAALEYLREALDSHRGDLWDRSAELADLIDVVGTHPLTLTRLVSSLTAGGVPVARHVQEELASSPGVNRFLRSFVWITRGGEFLGTGVAVRPGVVLTTAVKPSRDVLHVHRLGGKDLRVTDHTMRGGTGPTVGVLHVDGDDLTAAPLAYRDDDPAVAVWHTWPERGAKVPGVRLSPAGSEVVVPPPGTALIDAEGRLRSMVARVVDDGTTRIDVTHELIEDLVSGHSERVAMFREMREEMRRAPLIYLSYARAPVDDPLELEFFGDLLRELQELVQGPVMPADFSEGMHGDEDWQERMKDALAGAQVFVPLYSPDYFSSQRCGMEWDAFSRRQTEEGRLAMVPVVWAPVPRAQLPRAVRGVPYRTWYGGGSGYPRDGLMSLYENKPRDYRRLAGSIARHIVEVALGENRLSPCDPSLFDDLRNAFEDR
ncbi:SAV_2336 N-terminal domain-related protein [Streptomyces dysideae]|uniref:TIR domain-containing protein n=1 Tax=Streptomyces dysideae TaxID=909626 RepID=A0A101UY09_9ACTN|nr:toll/interleukin-1 receptor domain-containing protein [Streptomyces dysideae]KUO18938.1 hypothetical protein AQJ91_22285 [Streptomyces dysideae]